MNSTIRSLVSLSPSMWYSTASQNLSVTRRLLLSSPFDPLPSRLRVLERRAVHVILATRQVKLGDPSAVQNGASNSATQD
ncbi:hypothetical protein H5410_015725 [Solanum commersonii]|uniref:Uncharacterized protein n=1 Tax=Solanum commersonii TaxID=4109 RepID=A0A9J5ZUA5_SOLCO|nr:hypothetical protein H5410_015725 [Solanum commersonii]